MKDKRAHRTSLSAFLAETDRVGATLIKHTRAHRAQRGEGAQRVTDASQEDPAEEQLQNSKMVEDTNVGNQPLVYLQLLCNSLHFTLLIFENNTMQIM